MTFSEEAIKLTSGIFQQWFINKSPDAKNAGSDDDLLFFVRNSVEKVFLYNHVITPDHVIPQGESKVDVARKDSTTLPRYCIY